MRLFHRRREALLFLGTALLVYLADQATKRWIVATLGASGGRATVPVVGDWLRLSYVTNTGAAFGLFPDQALFFSLVAIGAVPLLVYLNRYVPPGQWLARLSLGLLLGGTLGNLTDRLRLGYVVDFIDAGIHHLRWPAFNLADSAFVIGVALLAWRILRAPEFDEGRRDRRSAA